MKKPHYVEGKEAQKRFESAMTALFRAPKPPKHEPKTREKKGKD
jgi:hypothetical protein